MRRLLTITLLATAVCATPALAGSERRCDASAVREAMAESLAAGAASGLVYLVERDGRPFAREGLGRLRPGDERPMPTDAVFRIYSMTRPVTSVAILKLWEAGRLELDAPISRHLPEMSALEVGTWSPRGELVGTRPASRPVTVRDLLTHTSGIGYGDPLAMGHPVGALYDRAGVTPLGGPADIEAALSGVPLAEEPGTRWRYGYSTDLLGRIVEAVEGLPLDAALRRLVFEPLGMTETTFRGPISAARAAEASDAAGQERLSGGAGLWSTAEDFARFARMLARGGELDGRRHLQEATVRMMVTDQLPAGARRIGLDRAPDYLPGPDHGFGFGVRVRDRIAVEPEETGRIGAFGWGGLAGTDFWVDPERRLVVVLMVQDTRGRALHRRALRRALAGCDAGDGA